jgi:hypothetical protein
MIDHTEIILWQKTKQKTFKNRVEELCKRMHEQAFEQDKENSCLFYHPVDKTYRIFLGAFWACEEILFVDGNFHWVCTKAGKAKNIFIDAHKNNTFGFLDDPKFSTYWGSPKGVVGLATPIEASLAKRKLENMLMHHTQDVKQPFNLEQGLRDKRYIEDIRRA